MRVVRMRIELRSIIIVRIRVSVRCGFSCVDMRVRLFLSTYSYCTCASLPSCRPARSGSPRGLPVHSGTFVAGMVRVCARAGAGNRVVDRETDSASDSCAG